MKKQNLLKFNISLLLIIVAYLPTILWMIDRWSAKDTYYSHGFLVPFISVFLIWLKKDKLLSLKIKPDSLGWLFLIPGIVVHLISALWRIYFTSGFSLIFVLAGMVLLFFGRAFLRQILFALLFLLFMLPLPLVAIANISFKLKIFAAAIATFMINKLGIPAIREGSIIKTMHSYLVVEDPCSGIRSLIALIALGALMTYLSNLSWVKKIILFSSAIPIAVGTNIIRIVALTMVSEIYGTKYAMGFFHDAMGILVFVLAFMGLSLVQKLLE